MSEEEVDHAASLLDDKLRQEPWFISSGVGETAAGPMIFIYSKNEAGPKKLRLDQGWMGFSVTVRVIGRIKRITHELSAA